MATEVAEEVAAVGEVSIIIVFLLVLSNNWSKDLVCSGMVKVMLLQLTLCDDSDQSMMLCGEAMVCFLCELDVLLLQTCIMIVILRMGSAFWNNIPGFTTSMEK